ncbi:hypothetical protein [Sulfolobus acidocaldarius]|uniref:hypothetical protein n=1 Tax=Sulfolobus acidocaldarius TaxID=2285 RepID=UPI000B5AB166|nr:hypothetical protein [Sulfolobus acidocaldarius]
MEREEPHRTIIWFVAAILVLTVLLSLVGNVNVKFIVPPAAQSYNYKKLTIPSSEIIEYMSQLPTTINSSSLTAYFPQNVLISSGSGNDILNNVLNVLSMNASVVAPGPYWEVADLAGFLQAHLTTDKSYLIVITNGTNGNNITYYNMTLPFFSASPLNVSYPPSDNVTVGSPTFRIINNYSVITNVQVNYTQSRVLVNNYSIQEGNTVYVYEYYGYSISGTAYLFANNNLISSQSFSFFVWPWGGTFEYTIYGFTTVPPGVPPGVSEKVFGNYSFTYWEGSDTQTVNVGNTTYIITRYYPVGPNIQTYGYTFNWNEYNVTIPVHIMVYNGTNPRTQVGNNVYNSRDIMTNFSYTIWSSAPQKSSSPHIITYDHIQVGNYTIERIWDAGTVCVVPKLYMQQSGNVINYYLTFSLSTNVAKQPSWVFNHVPASEVYSHNYADEFVNGPAYYYALARVLLNNFTTYQLFEMVHSIQSLLIITNTSWANLVDALKYGNGSLMDIYYQAMPTLFFVQYHNFTYQNNSVLIGAFNINNTINPIIIENKTVSLNGVNIDSLYKNAYINISKLFINGTYPFYRWVNYSSPPVLFEAYPVGNYTVKFLY